MKLIAVLLLMFTWLAFITWAILTPQPEPYEYHMAYNEYWYSEVYKGNIEDNALPPGYIKETQILFHFLNIEPVVKLRLTSVIFATFTLLLISLWYGPKQTLLIASLPWFILWSTRAQTDSMMLTAIVFGIILIAKTKLNFWGGFMIWFSSFIKPTSVLALIVSYRNKHFLSILLGFSVGILGFIGWLIPNWNYFTQFHSSSSIPFANSLNNLIAIIFGMGGALLLLFPIKYKQWATQGKHTEITTYIEPIFRNKEWFPPAIVFLLFAFFKAPWAHEYYLYPSLVMFGLMLNTNNKYYNGIIIGNCIISLWLLLTFNGVIT